MDSEQSGQADEQAPTATKQLQSGKLTSLSARSEDQQLGLPNDQSVSSGETKVTAWAAAMPSLGPASLASSPPSPSPSPLPPLAEHCWLT